MTDEQRLDRMERIVKLLIKAAVRARQEAREQARGQDEKINILIDMHLKNEERFAKNFADHAARFVDYEARLTRNEELAVKTEKRLEVLATKTEEKFAAMAAAQAGTQEQLKSLAATVEWVINERRNGRP